MSSFLSCSQKTVPMTTEARIEQAKAKRDTREEDSKTLKRTVLFIVGSYILFHAVIGSMQ